MSSISSSYLCPMCSYEASSTRTILSHLRIFHSNDPRFNVMCGIDGCAKSYKTFSAFYSHIYRSHRDCGIVNSSRRISEESSTTSNSMDSSAIQQDAELPPQTDDYPGTCVQADLEYLMGNDQRQRIAALFLLKLKEERQLTQVAIDDIVAGVTSMIDQSVSHVKAAIRAKLCDIDVDVADVPGFEAVFSELQQPFCGLETVSKQEKYFKDSFSLLEPQEIRIGDPEYVPRFCGDKREIVPVWDTFQYVPLNQTLTRLLQDKTVQDEIDFFPERIHSTESDILEDFCDGSRFKTHPLFSTNPRALQIIAYYDELEVCDPLGTHIKKHKLGVICFTLGNIQPKYRSSYRAINLVTIANSTIIEKHGINKVLQPFIEDLKHLSTDGIKVLFRDREEVFQGALLVFLADNLAANELGGFKRSFSFSYRYCRSCMMTNDQLTSSFSSGDFSVRTVSEHEKHCQLLAGPAGTHYSKTYGINVRSALLDVKYYSMFDGGLPCDCLHDILEGIAPLEIKLLMGHCISSNYFRLKEYNSMLLSYNFGYTETDKKPVVILSKSLTSTGSLRSTASQMLVLIRNLPFLIGDKIDEDDQHWKCFLLLRKIVDIVLCPKVCSGFSAILKLLIIEHHSLYVSLYGSSNYIPKFHLITHYPEQILSTGPIVTSWTMRQEGKLNFFKKASRVSNFKNVAQSVARRHQRWMCYELASDNLLTSPLECGPGNNPTPFHRECESNRTALLKLFPDICCDCVVFRPSWVTYNNKTYKANNCYLIRDTDGIDPIFVRLVEVLVIHGSQVVFIVEECKVMYFDEHFHSYVIIHTAVKSAICNLYDHNIYHSQQVGSRLHISLRYYFT